MNPINTQHWYTLVEGQVYLVTGTGHATAEIMQAIDEKFIGILESSPFPLVHIIHDVRLVLSIPSLNELRKVKYPYHPHLGYNVTIGAFSNPAMRFLVSMASAIFRTRSKDMTTLSEAYAYLLARDPSLPPLKSWNFPPEADTAVS